MIRQAEHKDAPAIRLLMQSEPSLWQESWRPDVLERAIDAAGGLAFVWEEGDLVHGFVCAHDLGFRGYLSQLVVAEEARGKEVGEQLVRRVQEELVERGCAMLVADVWPESEGFYRALGWQPPHAVLLKRRLMEPTI
jgi:ribosomal protein S18 acetylase RimI-like enzyme